MKPEMKQINEQEQQTLFFSVAVSVSLCVSPTTIRKTISLL